MTHKWVKLCVKVWRNFVHSDLVNCCGLLAVLQDPWRSGFHSRARMYPLLLLLLNPSTNTDIYDIYVDTLHIFPNWLIRFWQSLLWLSPALEFIVGWNINTGLWSENSFLTRKVVSGVLYPYNSEKSNAQKLEIPTNIGCLQLQEGPQTCLL